ncbi:hypothetical protein CLV60_108290 [Dyadobacter jiangsuensis]|uniref:Uncharacterized protein n=1 Tax=Dyadobacter jiangsuensis TaxID=1591085 RepID=A0A2P8G0D1_9BACT|nr:hypothetical protein CLV60_108290 [Dyadobacter jiangsuensis]
MYSQYTNQFSHAVETEMKVLMELGYRTEPLDTFNEDDELLIFCRLVVTNSALNRSVYFDFMPRDIYQIDIFIEDSLSEISFSISDYLTYERTAQPIRQSTSFRLDKNDFEEQLKRLLREVNSLLNYQLRSVMEGKVMVRIPSQDLRDDY